MASAYLYRTFGTPTNNKKWTYSLWIKRSAVTGNQALLGCGADGNNRGLIYLTDSGKLYYYETTNGTDTTEVATNRLFRDPSAWYHIVVAVDTTQSTASDRVKIYVNGTQETSLAASNYPNQDATDKINSGIRHDISGRNHAGTSDLYFDGQMAHVHFVDGTAYTPSTFGETDTTTEIWVPKTAPSVTYGTNGFFLKMDNSANMGLDSAGSNNLTTSGTIIQTKDTPSNVHTTLNPLIPSTTFAGNFSNINGTIATSTSAKGVMLSTFGASSGKWYFEMKHTNTDDIGVGIADQAISLNTWSPSTGNYVFLLQNGEVRRPSGSTSSGTTFTQNDIIGVAWNATDSEVTFYKNGTAINSGTAFGVEGTQGTMFFAVADTGTGSDPTASFNFGNGYFGTTAVSSAGSNGNGSVFEYDVPTGYYALNTKNIGTQS
jgi:hypothetical protein